MTCKKVDERSAVSADSGHIYVTDTLCHDAGHQVALVQCVGGSRCSRCSTPTGLALTTIRVQSDHALDLVATTPVSTNSARLSLASLPGR